MKLTRPMRRILSTIYTRGLAQECVPELSGADLMAVIDLGSGTLYPALMRLESAQLLSSRWAELNAKGSLRRRVYRITDLGIEEMRK